MYTVRVIDYSLRGPEPLSTIFGPHPLFLSTTGTSVFNTQRKNTDLGQKLAGLINRLDLLTSAVQVDALKSAHARAVLRTSPTALTGCLHLKGDVVAYRLKKFCRFRSKNDTYRGSQSC